MRAIACLALATLVPAFAETASLKVNVRSRVETFRGANAWNEVMLPQELPVSKTALLLCDMWDRHTCSGAEKRVGEIAPRLNALVELARSRGMLIIHAPSDTMSFYKDHPARRRMLAFASSKTPKPLDLTDPPLPIDFSDGGCDTGEKGAPPYPWTRQNAAIRIAPEDAISDSGTEVYGLLAEKGIQYLLMTGVHTNICVLRRTFAIRQMTKWGIRCVLVRDLTDAMYNPAMPPYVSHQEGTEMVIQHIEKYWCPTVLSKQLEAAMKAIP